MKRMMGFILILALTAAGCSSSGVLSLSGDIQNNIITTCSTVAGRIIKMNKQQGEPVKKGEVIAVIDNTSQKYVVDQLQAMVDMKKAKLEELLAGTRPQQIEQAQAQVRAAKDQLAGIAVAKEAVNAAQTTYDYLNTQYQDSLTLYQQGALPKNDLDNAKYKLDTAAKQLASATAQLGIASAAKANVNAASAQLKLLQSGATTQSIEAARADLNQTGAQLNQAKNTLNNCNITAMADGIIISKNYELGDVVNVGGNIADIAVANDLYVLCYIPDQYLSKICYNQPLTVITPTGTQTGHVSYIALKHEYTPKDKQSVSDKHIATKIKVAIKDDQGMLKSGLKATVEVPIK